MKDGPVFVTIHGYALVTVSELKIVNILTNLESEIITKYSNYKIGIKINVNTIFLFELQYYHTKFILSLKNISF